MIAHCVANANRGLSQRVTHDNRQGNEISSNHLKNTQVLFVIIVDIRSEEPQPVTPVGLRIDALSSTEGLELKEKMPGIFDFLVPH